MILETQKLINSEFDMLKKLGWLLYNREYQDGGLNKEELNALLQIVSEEGLYKEYKTGYNRGFEDGICP